MDSFARRIIKPEYPSGRIFITGDCHAKFHKFNSLNFSEQKSLTKDDYVIICGDFGGVWNKDIESVEEAYWMNWLNNKPFTTLFVDGNHENFDRLYSYPVEEWNGGKVHKIRPSVIHLMRGQVFELAGKKVFTFGGARSHDIQDGILELDDPHFQETRKALDKQRAMYRINHHSWWQEEMPSREEMEEGLRNLAKHDNAVDFIVSHDCPTSVQQTFGAGLMKPDALTQYFEKIKKSITYDKWFFGHYHDNREIDDKHMLLYDYVLEYETHKDKIRRYMNMMPEEFVRS